MSAPVSPEVAHALELARKKYGPNLEGAMPQSQQKLTPEMARIAQAQVIKALGHKIHPRKAHASGQHSKKQGFGRVSPYYNAEKSDHFWFAGYDGKTMEEAIAAQ